MTVSVCMITYNHERFISQAIESILAQEADFEFELVIGEDKSKDGTLSKCQHYAERFPGKISIIQSDQNVGMTENFLRTYRSCKGEFIAFCEGDDFWSDPHKLKKQVNYLKLHPELSSCFHNVILKRERNNEYNEWPLHENKLEKEFFGTIDVLGPWFIPSPSFMFRNYSPFPIPEWFHNCKFGDLPFMLLLTLKGDIGYIHEIMAVYRIHDTGLTAKFINIDKIMIMTYIYCNFDIHTNYKYHSAIQKSVEYEIKKISHPEPISLSKKASLPKIARKIINKLQSIISR